jgi:acyl-coenzyme A thioesterase PaaI-like protein
MPAITEARQQVLDATRAAEHPECVVCGAGPGGLALAFRVVAGGAVEAELVPTPALQGYPEMLHGGVIASVLDAAMTNCLFARGLAAVTGQMTIRYRRPLRLTEPATARGALLRAQPPLLTLEATLQQAGRVAARATGKFMIRGES